MTKNNFFIKRAIFHTDSENINVARYYYTPFLTWLMFYNRKSKTRMGLKILDQLKMVIQTTNTGYFEVVTCSFRLCGNYPYHQEHEKDFPKNCLDLGLQFPTLVIKFA